MSLKKEDVWAELKYALDELERPWHDRDITKRLTDAASTSAKPGEGFDEYLARTEKVWLLSRSYSKARTRADTRIAHEAIEKGLKAILIEGGLSGAKVRCRGHELHRLLADIQRYNPTVFNELERCFDSTIQHLERITTIQHNTSIIDYFQEHGKAEVFIANRYESIEGNSDKYGMMGLIYCELIRALLSLIFGWTPKDVDSRIEEDAKRAILAESRLDPAWDVTGWLDRGPVHPRLETVENLEDNKVLRAAVRKLKRESKDSAIRYWAMILRHKSVHARREARAESLLGRRATAAQRQGQFRSTQEILDRMEVLKGV